MCCSRQLSYDSPALLTPFTHLIILAAYSPTSQDISATPRERDECRDLSEHITLQGSILGCTAVEIRQSHTNLKSETGQGETITDDTITASLMRRSGDNNRIVHAS